MLEYTVLASFCVSYVCLCVYEHLSTELQSWPMLQPWYLQEGLNVAREYPLYCGKWSCSDDQISAGQQKYLPQKAQEPSWLFPYIRYCAIKRARYKGLFCSYHHIGDISHYFLLPHLYAIVAYFARNLLQLVLAVMWNWNSSYSERDCGADTVTVKHCVYLVLL